MGVSRTWNGSTSNYLETIHGTLNNASTQFAWIRPASLGGNFAIFGNSYDAGYGWRISSANKLELFWSNGIVSDANKLSVPLLIANAASEDWLQVGVPLFVAISIVATAPTPIANFYAGFNPATVQLIGSNSGGPPIAPNGVQHLILGGNMYGLTPEMAFAGELDRLGRYGGRNLSLAELQAVAVCEATPPAFGLQFFYEITGASPELDDGGNHFDAVIHGLLPLGPELCGGTPPVDDSSSSGGSSGPGEPEDAGELRVTQVRKWYAWRLGPTIPEATCTFVPVVRILRTATFLPVMELDLYSTLRYTRRWTDLDDFELKLSCDTEQGALLAQLLKVRTPLDPPARPGEYVLAVAFNQLVDFVGFIDRIKVFKGSGRHEMTLGGYGLDRILSDRVLAPASGDEFDDYNDPVETIIKTMVDRHIKTPGSFTTLIPNFNEAQREVPSVLIAADNELGPTIVYNGRFQRLIEGIRDVLQAAEGTLGYSLQLVNGTLLFDVVPGNDRSLSVVFSPDYDNVSEFDWEYDGLNFSSHVVMGGQGTGATKLLQTVFTLESQRFDIERRESYLDASDSETTAKLDDKGKAFLQDKGKFEIIRIKKLPGSRPCYKEDWDVGDFVGLRDKQYNINVSRRIEEVTVSCAAGQVTAFDLVLAKSSPIGPLAQLQAWRQGATGAVARQ